MFIHKMIGVVALAVFSQSALAADWQCGFQKTKSVDGNIVFTDPNSPGFQVSIVPANESVDDLVASASQGSSVCVKGRFLLSLGSVQQFMAYDIKAQ